jgi:hypothetical protein
MPTSEMTSRIWQQAQLLTDGRMPQPGIDPAFDVVLECHDRAGRAENQQVQRRNEP